MRRRRVSQVAALLGLACVQCAEAPPHPCELAVDELDARSMVNECRGEWEPYARLGRGWSERIDDPVKVFADAESLVVEVGSDAHFLAGYVAGSDTKSELTDKQALPHLTAALEGYLADGRHRGASRAAAALSRLSREAMSFDMAWRMAELALTEATASGHSRVIAQAWQARGEILDKIGRAKEAGVAFEEAKALYTRPDDLAFVSFKHGLLVLDRRDAAIARQHLDEAAAFRDRAKESGLPVGDLDFALPLNRALVLSLLDKPDAAKVQLAAIESDLADEQRAKVAFVQGFLAAKEGDLEVARRWFDDAGTDELDGDYSWTAAMELARLYRSRGQVDDALALYEKAIEFIERLRSDPSEVELRPWILSRRRQPYVEHLELLAQNGRAADALAVAESLHGRALLDVVLSRMAGYVAPPDAIRDTELRMPAMSAPRMSTDQLMKRVGMHEALIFVTVDDGFWRFHLANGKVTSQRFFADDLGAVLRFRGRLDDSDAAERAGKILLPEDLMASDQPLILVGDVAWQTPFAALWWKGDLFRDVRPVAYLPGLAAIECSNLAWDDSAVVLGDAEGTLPNAVAEARDVASNRSTSALTGSGATWTALKTAKSSKLLHVAVHGRMHEGEMKLVLYDRKIAARQILEEGIAPAEVVLSGCNTGNANGAPESWTGFPSAFLSAGSRFVISTLQSVEDPHAAAFVGEYYRHRATLDPPRAVQAAQRSMPESVPTKDWASFTAWGSPACELP